MTSNNNNEVRFCKKCGCELVSTNKHKTCANCRHSRNEKIKNRFIAPAALAVVACVKKFGPKVVNTLKFVKFK